MAFTIWTDRHTNTNRIINADMILNTARLFREHVSSSACHIIYRTFKYDGLTASFSRVQFHKSRVWQAILLSHLNITLLICKKKKKNLSSLKQFKRVVWFASEYSARVSSLDISRCLINHLESLESFVAINWWGFRIKMTHQLGSNGFSRHFILSNRYIFLHDCTYGASFVSHWYYIYEHGHKVKLKVILNMGKSLACPCSLWAGTVDTACTPVVNLCAKCSHFKQRTFVWILFRKRFTVSQ